MLTNRMASELESAQIPTAAGNRILVPQKRKEKKKKRLNFLDIDYTCVAKVFYQLQNLGVTSSNIEQSLLF